MRILPAQPHRSKISSVSSIVSAALFALSTASYGQTATGWRGTTSSNMQTAANWDNGFGSNYNLFLGQAWHTAGRGGSTTVNNGSAYSGYRLNFENITGGANQTFTLTGSAISLFDFGVNNPAIINASNVNQNINAPIVFNPGSTGASLIQVNGGSGGNLTFGSTISLGGNGVNANQLRISGANGNTVTFGGIISNTAGQTGALNSVVVSQGSSNITVVYNAANTYNGDTFIDSGTLQFGTAASSAGSANSSILRLGANSANSGAATINLATTAGGVNVGSTIVVRPSSSGSEGTRTLSSSNTSGTNTFSGAVAMDTVATVTSTNSGGTLAFTGATFELKTFGLLVNGAGDTTISNLISSTSTAGQLTKSGTGTLTLSGANTFTGTLAINTGTLKIASINNASSNGTLGNSSGAVLIGSADQTGLGTLQYSGGGTASSNRNFTIGGGSGGGGTIQVDGASTVLTLSGIIATQQNTNVGGNNTATRGNFIKTGAGTLVLTNAGNTQTGITTVNGGTIQYGGTTTSTSNPVNTSFGAQQFGNNFVNINSGGTVQLITGGVTGNEGSTLFGGLGGGIGSGSNSVTFVVNAGGTLTQSDNLLNLLPTLQLNGGTVSTGTGVSATNQSFFLKGSTTVAGSAASTINARAGTSNNGIHLNGAIFNVADATLNSEADLLVSANLLDAPAANGGSSQGFIKSGPGIMLVSGTNTFTGNVVIADTNGGVNGGILKLGSASALGTTGGNTQIGSGQQTGTLDVNGFSNSENFSVTKGTLINSGASTSTLGGSFTNNQFSSNVASVIGSLTDTGDITITGQVTSSNGGSGLVKVGPRTLTLTNGGNNLGGTLDVNGGTFKLLNSGIATSFSSYNVRRGGVILVDNSGAANSTDRISSNTITSGLGGGGITFLGANSAASTETTGQLNAASGLFTATSTTGTGVASNALTFSSFSRTAGAAVTFAGANLGTSSNKILFTSAPTLTNRMIRGAVIGNEFATYNQDGNGTANANGLQAIAPAGYTTTFGASNNVKLTTAGALGSAANSLNLQTASGQTFTNTALSVGDILSSNSGSGTNVISGGTVTSPNTELVITTINDLTFDSTANLTGNVTLTKSGAATLTLSKAASTRTSAVTYIDQGTIKLTQVNGLYSTNSTGSITIGANSTLELAANMNDPFPVLLNDNGATLKVSGGSSVTNTTNVRITSLATDPTSVNLTAASSSDVLTLNAAVQNVTANTAAPVININGAGTVIVGSSASNGTTAGSANNGSYSWDVNGGGKLLVNSTGVSSLGLAGNSVKVTSGILGLGSDNTTNYNYELAGGTLAGAGAGTRTISSSSNIVLTSGTTSTIDARDAAVGATANMGVAFAGVIRGSGILNIAASGTGVGTVTISGANTYSGGTTVTSGRLLVNNTTGSGTGTGAVTVGVSGTLGGTGIITGPLAVNGTLAPGTSPGNLTVNNNVTFGSTGTFSLELNGTTAGSQYDTLTVGGTGVLAVDGNLVLSLGFAPAMDTQFTIATVQGTDTASNTGAFTKLNGVTTNLNQGAFFSASGVVFQISYQAEGLVFDNGALVGNNIMLQVVPEPSTWVMLLTGFGTLALIQRSRSRSRR